MGFGSIGSPDGKDLHHCPAATACSIVQALSEGYGNSTSLNTATSHTVPTSSAQTLLRSSTRWASGPRQSPEPLPAPPTAPSCRRSTRDWLVSQNQPRSLTKNGFFAGLHHFQVSSGMTLAFATGLIFGARGFGAHLRFLEVRWSCLGLFWLRGDVDLKCEHLHLAAHTSSQGVKCSARRFSPQDHSSARTRTMASIQVQRLLMGPSPPSKAWGIFQPFLATSSAVRPQTCPETEPNSIPSKNPKSTRSGGLLTQMWFLKRWESPKSTRLPKSRCPAQAQKQLGGPRGAAAGCLQALLRTSRSRCLRNQPLKKKRSGLCPSSLNQSVHGAGRGRERGCAATPRRPSSTV